MQLGPAEILVVLVIALLVFGPNKLPEVGRQVGRAMKEFRQFQRTMSRDISQVFVDPLPSAESAPPLAPNVTAIDVPSTDVPSTDVAPQSPAEAASDPTASQGAGDSTTDPEAHA